MTEKDKGSSPASQNPNAAAPAEHAGDVLRTAREGLGISIDEVAKKLKIHAHYVRALESSSYDQLPGDPYIRVYLKSISAFLSLNTEDILERFFKERGLTGVDTLRKDSSTKINLALKEKHRPNLTLIIAVFLIALLAVFSFIANRQGWLSGSQNTNAHRASDSALHTAAAFDSMADNQDTVAAGQTADQTVIETVYEPLLHEISNVPQPDAQETPSATRKKTADTLTRKATPSQTRTDSLNKIKAADYKPSPEVKKDTVTTTPLPFSAGTTTVQTPAIAKPSKDTLTKAKTAEAKPAATAPGDTSKTAAGSLWRSEDTAWPMKQKIDTAKKKNTAAPATVPVQAIIPGKIIRLRMTVTGDSCWARVYTDGKQWRNMLRRGRYKTFTAQDSLNVHVGANEAVSFMVNGQEVAIPGSGVISFKVDRNGVTSWSLDKWNSVFQGRY